MIKREDTIFTGTEGQQKRFMERGFAGISDGIWFLVTRVTGGVRICYFDYTSCGKLKNTTADPSELELVMLTRRPMFIEPEEA